MAWSSVILRSFNDSCTLILWSWVCSSLHECVLSRGVKVQRGSTNVISRALQKKKKNYIAVWIFTLLRNHRNTTSPFICRMKRFWNLCFMRTTEVDRGVHSFKGLSFSIQNAHYFCSLINILLTIRSFETITRK